MRLLLPVDSRLADTQGFITLGEDGQLVNYFVSEEKHKYVRKGFRGACVVNDKLYVCNSFSLKIYRITFGESETPIFSLLRQVALPEWLIGRGANADLHFPYYDALNGQLLIANSYMDSIDAFSLDGEFIQRKFLWEISEGIHELVRNRDPRAADLCHVNYIERVGDDLLLTLCNLNGSGEGAVISYRTGEMFLSRLGRPHDGVLYENEYYLTETSRNRVLLFNDIVRPEDLRASVPQVIDLSYEGADGSDNNFWLRGLLVTEGRLYVGCSQFQDRSSGALGVVPTHVVVVDKRSLTVIDRIMVPSLEGLISPVIYSLLDFDRILRNVSGR